MKYLDVYKKRISHLGSNPQDRAYQSGILEFRRYLKYNQHTERNLILERENLAFDGVILTDKEDENRVSSILLTKVVEDGGPQLKQGDLIRWNGDFWLLYRSTTSSYQPHQKFYMVKCNYYIKWLDSDGMVNESWVYLVGSKDAKIKDNFRTWHNAITPQPNKYIQLMMPHQRMALGTEIMVLDEVWYLVDYDQNSVPGVIFMSFTETNLNEQRDSIENNLANADKQANWTIEMIENRVVEANSIFDLNYSILKDGVIQEVKPEIILNGDLIELENNQYQIGMEGSASITVKYKNISKTQTITIGNSPTAEVLFIGDSKIRVASTNKYILENADSKQVEFILEDTKNLVEMKIEGNTCIITANSNNKLGSFKLKAKYDEKEITKTIYVVSLWQVI